VVGVSELVPRTRHLRGRTWHGVRQVQQGAGANVCFSSCAAAARAHSQCAWQNEWLEALEGIKDDLQTVIAEQASDTVDHQRTLKWYNLRYPEEQADIQNPGTIRPSTEILNTANDFFEFTQVSLTLHGRTRNFLNSTLPCGSHAVRGANSLLAPGVYAGAFSSLKVWLPLYCCAEGNFPASKGEFCGGTSFEETECHSGDAGNFFAQAPEEAPKVPRALV